jgi:acyl dehydratase
VLFTSSEISIEAKEDISVGGGTQYMTDIKTKKVDQVYYDDVTEGDVLPSIKKHYSLQKIALFASVHGDWCPGHYDYKWAKEKFNQPAPFAYGFQITTHCSQVLTDWMGPYGALKKFKSRTLTPVYPEDVLAIKAKVTRKYIKENTGYVECEVWAIKQDGKIAAKASGKLLLPVRGSDS